MITKTPWFGERRFLPGFPRPVSWQGWVVSVIVVAVIVLDARYLRIPTPLGVAVLVLALAAYALMAWLTGGGGWSWGRFGR